MTRALLLCCIVLTGCTSGPRENYAPVYSNPPGPGHSANMRATADCHGPWVSWSSTIETSKFPYSFTVTQTMRCLKDGRVVGPYTYDADPL